MAIFNAAGMSATALLNHVGGKLLAHRKALAELADLYKWSSGVSSADLTAQPPAGPGLTQPDADALLSAIADARAEYLIHTTGQAPASYPQVPTSAPGPYIYETSQNRVIGPLLT
jgi:hypothetical protein